MVTTKASCAIVTKSGNFNFLEPSGPLRVCNGTDLPLPLAFYNCFFNNVIIRTQLKLQFLVSLL